MTAPPDTPPLDPSPTVTGSSPADADATRRRLVMSMPIVLAGGAPASAARHPAADDRVSSGGWLLRPDDR